MDVKDQFGLKKVSEIYLNKKAVVHVYNPSYTEAEVEALRCETGLGKKHETLPEK
jgi:hypothetical protein